MGGADRSDLSVLVYDELSSVLADFATSEPVRVSPRCALVYLHRSESEKSAPKVQLCYSKDPKLLAPMGLTEYLDELGIPRRRLTFQLEHPQLIEALVRLDDYIRRLAFEKCKDWFGKELSEADVSSLYEPLVGRDGERSALKASVDRHEVRLWRESDDGYGPGGADDLQRLGCCWPNVAIGPIWFLPQRFGCALRCTDILLFDRSRPQFPFRT